MLVIGSGVAWGWPAWLVGLLGLGFLGAAFVITRTMWNQVQDAEEAVRAGLTQLHQMGISEIPRNRVSADRDNLSKMVSQTVTSITARMASLEEEREKVVAIMENLVEGVLAFDQKGQVLFANPRAFTLLSLDSGQIQGRSMWEIIRNQELAKLVENCQHLALHESQRAEVELHAPAFMVLEVYALPFPLSDQKKGSVLVFHDVTELRRLEQVRAEFIDNVSHELRTPLAAIVGYLETLIDEPSLETPGNRKFVHIAHHHAERLSRLVNDLRSLSEIESGKVILRCEAVQLEGVVEEVCEMFQSQVVKKGLQVSNHVNTELYAWADRDRLIQILVNLIDNALKYTPAGGSISFHVHPQGNERIILQVKDTGQGISSTDLPRITQRFYRVDRARSREEGGTGLGLSIVKHLTQLLGGQFRIHSELGKGTTVEMELPISSTSAVPSSPR